MITDNQMESDNPCKLGVDQKDERKKKISLAINTTGIEGTR